MVPRPEDWPRVRDVIESALALPADGRRAYVAKAVIDWLEELRQRVPVK